MAPPRIPAAPHLTPPSPGGASHLGRFKTLLRNLQVAERAAEAALDWMDDNQEVSQTGLDAGAEDHEYLGQEPAYRTSDRRLAHISELRLLHGMTQADFERLAPHVCALPTDRLKINVNTATSQTLAALEPTAMVDELRLQRLMETERAFEGPKRLHGARRLSRIRRGERAAVGGQRILRGAGAGAGRPQHRRANIGAAS